MIPLLSRPGSWLSALFDRLTHSRAERWLEQAVYTAAVLGFLGHLILIALIHNEAPFLPAAWQDWQQSYLAAIYTPFSIILFYEVLELVFALPRSLTSSIAIQYEIFSLIIIRNVFKEIGRFHSFEEWFREYETMRNGLIDMGGAALMFLIVAVFYQLRPRNRQFVAAERLDRFVKLKKSVALLLCLSLFGLAIYSVALWVQAFVQAGADPAAMLGKRLYFFPEFFELMIFADVVILIVSFGVYEDYSSVFRNSGFVVSTILLRLALSTPRPYDVGVALVGMTFGLIVLAIYRYFISVNRDEAKPTSEPLAAEAEEAIE